MYSLFSNNVFCVNALVLEHSSLSVTEGELVDNESVNDATSFITTLECIALESIALSTSAIKCIKELDK